MAILNLKTGFGVVGNGTADDTSAINAAVAAAVSGDNIFLPAGNTCLVDFVNEIVGKDNVTFSGGGLTSIIKKRTASSTNRNVITFRNCTNCTVSNLAIDGQGPSQVWFNANPYTADYENQTNITNGTAVAANNLAFIGGNHNTAFGVYSHNAGAGGFRFTTSPYGLVLNCTGDSNGFGSVIFYPTFSGGATIPGSGSDYSIAKGNTFDIDYCDSMRAYVCFKPQFLNNKVTKVRGNGFGTDQFAASYFAAVDQGVMDGNDFSGSSNRGIDCDDGSGSITEASTNCIITNNKVYNHPNNGILLGRSGFIVSGNICSDNTTFGIAVRGSNHTIVYNQCTAVGATQAYGIGLFTGGLAPTNAVVSHNDLRANTVAPIDPALVASAGYTAVSNFSAVTNTVTKPYQFVAASLTGNVGGVELSSYAPRIADKNAGFQKSASGTVSLTSTNQGLSFSLAGGNTGLSSLYTSPALAPNELITLSIQMYISGTASNEVYYLMAAFVDASNYFDLAMVVNATTTTMTLENRVAGSATTIGSAAPSTPAGVHTITLQVLAGNLVTVSLDGTPVTGLVNKTAVASFTNKRVGLSAYATTTAVGQTSLFNFSASSIVPDVPITQTYSLGSPSNVVAGTPGIINVALPGGTIAPTGTTVTLTPSAGLSLNGGSAGAAAAITLTPGVSTVPVTVSAAVAATYTVTASAAGSLIDPAPLSLPVVAATAGGGSVTGNHAIFPSGRGTFVGNHAVFVQ